MNRSYWELKEAEDARRYEWRLLDEAARGRPGRVRRRLGELLMAVGANLAGVRRNAPSA